jgi:hypothetical protein
MAGKRPRTTDNPERSARAERLAAALRANMKRRKAQARARAQTGGVEPAHDSAGFVQESASDKAKG